MKSITRLVALTRLLGLVVLALALAVAGAGTLTSRSASAQATAQALATVTFQKQIVDPMGATVTVPDLSGYQFTLTSQQTGTLMTGTTNAAGQV